VEPAPYSRTPKKVIHTLHRCCRIGSWIACRRTVHSLRRIPAPPSSAAHSMWNDLNDQRWGVTSKGGVGERHVDSAARRGVGAGLRPGPHSGFPGRSGDRPLRRECAATPTRNGHTPPLSRLRRRALRNMGRRRFTRRRRVYPRAAGAQAALPSRWDGQRHPRGTWGEVLRLDGLQG